MDGRLFRYGLIRDCTRTDTDSPPSYRSDHRMLIVNLNYDGNDRLGRLMADFREPIPEKINDPFLKKWMAEIKYTKEGQKFMCEVMEEYGDMRAKRAAAEGEARGEARGKKEAAREIARNLIRSGAASLNVISEVTGLSLPELHALM